MDQKSLFLQALDLKSPEQRTAFLQEQCGEDQALRQQVEALLAASEQVGNFLEQPAVLHAEQPQDQTCDLFDPSNMPGSLGRMDQYEILAKLGQGGSGVVYKAHDPTLNRTVAIKALAPQIATDATARQRFAREACLTASVSHPHLITIHAVGEHRQIPYLVMEYIHGQSLEQKLQAVGMLPAEAIQRIALQAAQGLAAAHARGLIHRDIKPANILLENSIERVKISDFGIARAIDDTALTNTGHVIGTPKYMSPEQAQGLPLDHRSDLFSLGSVLYAMCTGRSPFRGDTTLVVVRNVCEATPRPIEEINPEVPPWIISIINRLLAKHPADRIQTAADLAELLSQPSTNLPPAPPLHIPFQLALPRSARARLILGTVVAYFLVYISVAIYYDLNETSMPSWLDPFGFHKLIEPGQPPPPPPPRKNEQ